MSAIFGIVRFDGSDVSRRDLERMGHALAHRGPDGHRLVLNGPVALGHSLMRVNREDRFERQPIVDSEAGLTLAADCRIDNRQELADAFGLSAADIRDMPDSAFILRAYQTWDEGCAEHLLGDFVFALWDARANKLVLARDHMGQRYMHYHRGKDFFAFATDVKALWALPDVPRRLDERQLGRRLLLDLSSREGATLFEGIFGLTGATIMSVRIDGTTGTRSYWEPRADPVHVDRDERYYVEAYRRILGEAVACRIRRTLGAAPGLLLSGGYDSAAIAGLAGQVLAGDRKLIAASSVMPAHYRGDIRHARAWVEMCARDMPHLDVHFVTREGKTVLSGLDQAFSESGVPAGSYHFATTEMLSTLAGKGVRLLLDGHGGDSTLHPRGQAALAWLLAHMKLRRFWSELKIRSRQTLQSRFQVLRSEVLPLLLPPAAVRFLQLVRGGRTTTRSDGPISSDFAQRLAAQGFSRAASAPRARVAMRRQMVSALRRASGDAAPGMSANAAFRGLDLTRPFNDKRVVELALAIPEDLYVKNGRNRYLACAALEDVYPTEFQTRWRKNDDVVPDFLAMAKSVEPQLLAELARLEKLEYPRRYFDFKKIRQLLAARERDDHNSGWEQETQRAVHAFVLARYVEWLRRDNE